MNRSLVFSSLALMLALMLAGAAAAHAQTTGTTGNGTGGGTGSGAATGRSAQTVNGPQPRGVAAQNRELDQIGRKLLKETPKNPPNSEAATGGGLEPPKH